MTNSQIKKIFKYSMLFFSSIIFAMFLALTYYFIVGKDIPNQSANPFIIFFSLLIPFIVVAIIRIYNLLIHGKFVVEE